MKVLLNDGMHKKGVEILEQAGIEIDSMKKTPEELAKCIGDYDGIVIRSATKLRDQKIIEAGAPPGGKLKIIGRSGVGYGNVNLDAAAYNGVVVKNAPFGNSISTAELALGLMLSVSRNIAQSHRQLNDGVWKKKKFMGIELNGKTLGIIGCGRIGQGLAQWTGNSMKIIGYDKNVEQVQQNFSHSKIEYVSFERLLEESDFISIHVDAEIEIIGSEHLKMMKKGSVLINTSRGICINEEALFTALNLGEIAGAGLDVHTNEPKEGEEFSSLLLKNPKVTTTSHLGASTNEAQIKTSEEMARVMRDYLLGGNFLNAVNMENGDGERSHKKDLYNLFFHHENVKGVFGDISTLLGENDINIKDINSKPFKFREMTANRAMGICKLYDKPSMEVLARINCLNNIIWAQ